MAPIEVDCSFSDGFNSDGLAVRQMVVGNSSDCLGVASMEVRCNSSNGLSSEGHTVTQMVLDSVGVSFNDSVVALGKADRVDMPLSMGIFLAVSLQRMMDAGLVNFGVNGVDKAGSGSRVHLIQGVDDKCTRQIDVVETD